VLFYFEEAHNLFRSDDRDLTSVYNKLAKEGAKFRIGMVYATQSMTTLSPDLLKNTENFFIAHLNDDREIKEIERRYEFSGVGLDVQRARSKGYVRMITLSHRYALPVQVKLFEPSTPPS
jgi:DNA helicase HerA-like ATPase